MNKHEQEAAYRLAALDQDFILGDSMRGARFMMEYTKAEQHLRAQKILSTMNGRRVSMRQRVNLAGSPRRGAARWPRMTAGGPM